MPRYATPDGPNDYWYAFTAGGSPLQILKGNGAVGTTGGAVTRGKRKGVKFIIKVL